MGLASTTRFSAPSRPHVPLPHARRAQGHPGLLGLRVPRPHERGRSRAARAMRIGAAVRLIVTGEISAKAYKLGTGDDAEFP